MISAEIRLEIFYVTAYMKRVIEVNCVFFGNNWYLHVSNCNLRNSWAFPTELEKTPRATLSDTRVCTPMMS